MAINIFTLYGPVRAGAPTADYPVGFIKNESVPGANDGTPLDQQWANDYAGFDAALFAEAGITPDGQPDTASSSQRLTALKIVSGKTSGFEFDNVTDAQIGATSAASYITINDAGYTWMNTGNTGPSGTTDFDNGVFYANDGTEFKINTDGYIDPIAFGASTMNPAVNSAAIQSVYNYSGKLISHNFFEIQSPITIPSGARTNFLDSGGIVVQDGYLTSNNGQSMLILDSTASDILFEGMTLNANSGPIDFGVWPNTPTTGNESSVGLTSPVKLCVHQSNKNVKYKRCNFLNSVGDAIKEFGTFSAGTQGEIDVDDCYFDLIRGNCIDGEYGDITVTRCRVNLIGDIRQNTRGGLIVVTADNALVTDIKVRQTTDSTIYLNGTGRGKHVVNSINIRYSGKDAVKVLNATDNSLFGDINVLAAGKTPVGFFGGTVANGVLGTIKIGFSKGEAPIDILDQADVTWSTPKIITACNIQEPKWDQGGGNGGAAFAITDSNVAFSTLSVSSYTGLAVNLAATNIAGGNVSVNYGDGAAIYETTSNLSLDNLQISESNQDVTKSPFGGVHAIQALGSSNMSITSVVFKDLGGGLLITGPDTFRMNIDDLIGDGFNTEANSDAHLIYANAAASPDTVTEINISNAAVKGLTTAGRMIWARNVKGMNICNWNSEGGSEGIRLASCSRINLSNVIVRNTGSDGVRASGCSNVSLSNVQSYDNPSSGIKTDSDCTDVIVLGCQASGNTVNLDIQGTNVKPSVIADFNIG